MAERFTIQLKYPLAKGALEPDYSIKGPLAPPPTGEAAFDECSIHDTFGDLAFGEIGPTAGLGMAELVCHLLNLCEVPKDGDRHKVTVVVPEGG